MPAAQQLNQPYPLPSFTDAVKRDIYFAGFLTVFLLVFKPFGLNRYGNDHYYIFLGYGFVSFFASFLNDYIAYHFLPGLFDDRRWKVYKHLCWMLWHLLVLGVANFSYAASLGDFPWTMQGFLKVQAYVFLSAILPIGTYILWRQNHLLKQNLQKAREMDRLMENAEVPAAVQPSDPELQLNGENQREELKVPASRLLYLQSQDNYVQVVYLQDQAVKKTLLRGTLSRFEAELADLPMFFRCHRAFLVNLDHLRHVAGNSQGLLLTLDHGEEEVPVSRGRSKELRERLRHRSA